MDAAIETRGLKKHFGTVRAVDGLDLVVGTGEMLGLVGPDGAGKTTTIRMLTGVIAPTAGSATVLGHDLEREVDAIKPRIGYLSQQFSLYGDLSVDENIEFFASIHNVRDFRRRRDELLAFTRLTPFRRRLADRLSGGMKQKLALACTLIHKPELIFLDEPTTGVDPVSRRDFWLILADLLRQDITIVMTTPYLDEAERCTHVGLMYQGRLIRLDEPRRIIEGLHGTLLQIRSAAPHEAYRAVRAEGRWASAHLFGERLHVLAEDPEAATRDLTGLLAAAGIGDVEVQPVPPTLEDVFIELISRADTNHGNGDNHD